MELLCVGQLVADILVKNLEQVDFGKDTERVETISVKSGGDCLNTAVAAAKMGAETRFVGKVGDDALGDYLRKVIAQSGVDAAGLKVVENVPTSACVVAINREGERVFFYYGGTNDSFCYEDVSIEDVEQAKIVHVGGTYNLPSFDGQGAARLFEEAQKRGKITSMDVTYDSKGVWLKTIESCFAHLDYFMPSINEAKHITGTEVPEDIAAFFMERGVRNVVVKLGAKGAYFKNAEEEFYFPAYDVKVVDTTGAGDSFVAGFLAGLTKGFHHREAVRLGSAVSAFCIQSLGASTGIPDYSVVQKFIEERGI